MTLEKAIEIMLDHYMTLHPHGDPNLRPAVNISIQALKHIEATRRAPVSYNIALLPGETKD